MKLKTRKFKTELDGNEEMRRDLLWEAEIRASTFGAAMVAQSKRVPTPNPAISLAVILSISHFAFLVSSNQLP